MRARASDHDLARHEVGARRRLAPTGHAVNRLRGEEGELWQPRFFDRALCTVKEYNEKVECIHLNPVKAGLASRPEDWRWSSYNEYAGMSAEEQKKRCGLIVDRVRILSDPRANLMALSRDRKDADHKTGGPRYSLLVVLPHGPQCPINEASLEQASHFPTRTVDSLRRSIFDGFRHPGDGERSFFVFRDYLKGISISV